MTKSPVPNKFFRTACLLAQKGDVILVAGKGHEDYQVIGHEKIHLDEREVVAEYIKTGREEV